MGREQSLLQRIARRDQVVPPRGQASAGEDVEALMESVRRHLARLINSRHGMNECLPDYGLPALTDLTVGVGDHVQIMQDAVQTAIQKYEPRLRRVRVSRVMDEDEGRSLAFRVDAVLVGKSGEHRVWYETSMSGEGQFDVEG